MDSVSKKNRHSFYLLNITQFLAALNDNVFKLLVIYFLIHLKGTDEAPQILSMASIIFVLPFLLFSSGAGVLADKISKRTIIVIAKWLELIVTLFGVLAVYLESAMGSYIALFFMAGQNALLGPAKYGIIAELVGEQKVSKANGSVTSLTYLAIILGTFFASFITDITNKNFIIETLCCVVIAIIGLLTSMGIVRTKAQGSKQKVTPFFLYEIYQTLQSSKKIPHLLTAIFSSSFFLFVGSFTQLNMIPFAIQSLHLSEVGGGYLFLTTAIGVAAGAFFSGRLSKEKVEPGISCISGFFIALFFLSLALFSGSLTLTIIALTLLGIVGGSFLVPLNSFLQVSSPNEYRGQVIAAESFFSFTGVLLSALFLYFIVGRLKFSAASGFAMMSSLSLLANIVITGKMSSYFFPFFITKILKYFRKVLFASSIPPASFSKNPLIIVQNGSWWSALSLFVYFPKLKIFILDRQFPWFNGWIDSILILPTHFNKENEVEKLIAAIKKGKEENKTICLLINSKEKKVGLQKNLNLFQCKFLFANMTKRKASRYFSFFPLYRKEISIHFSSNP